MSNVYRSEETRDNPWHLDMRFSIGLILAILLQCGCFIWYGAKLDSKVQDNAGRVETLEAWRMKQDDQLSKLSTQQSSQGQKLDDLVATVHHTDDIIEKYFYRK